LDTPASTLCLRGVTKRSNVTCSISLSPPVVVFLSSGGHDQSGRLTLLHAHAGHARVRPYCANEVINTIERLSRERVLGGSRVLLLAARQLRKREKREATLGRAFAGRVSPLSLFSLVPPLPHVCARLLTCERQCERRGRTT